MEVAKEELMKANIIESAKGLFQQYGLAKTTMEDIAKSIGKGKSTLYYYFATKEEIFEAVILKEKENMIAQIERAIEKADTAETKLKAFAKTINEELNSKKGLILNIINSDADIIANMCIMSAIKKKYDRIELDLIKSIIAFGIKSGEFNKAYKNKLDAVALIAISALRGLQINCVFDEKADNKNYINLYAELFIKSLKP